MKEVQLEIYNNTPKIDKKLLLYTLLISALVCLVSISIFPVKFWQILILVILCLLILYFSKSIKLTNIGYILLKENEIVVYSIIVETSESLNINTINQIVINYHEYEGGLSYDSNGYSYTDGLNNNITISIKNMEKTYKILIKEADVYYLDQMVKAWQLKGSKVIIKNRWGLKIKNIKL